MKIAAILRWSARIWSVASLVFIAAFALGGAVVPTATEAVGLLFFPIGALVGLLVGWWREGLGGAIAVASLIAFYLWLLALDGRLPPGPYFLLLAAPGFLFLGSWLIGKSAAPIESGNPRRS